MKINIKVTPGLLDSLARLKDIEERRLNDAVQQEAEKLNHELMSEHFDRLCAEYHLSEGRDRR